MLWLWKGSLFMLSNGASFVELVDVSKNIETSRNNLKKFNFQILIVKTVQLNHYLLKMKRLMLYGHMVLFIMQEILTNV